GRRLKSWKIVLWWLIIAAGLAPAAVVLWPSSPARAPRNVAPEVGAEAPTQELPPVEPSTAGNRFSPFLTLPSNPDVEAKLEAAADYARAKDWARGAQTLQWVLDHPEDCFVALKRPGQGGEAVDWVSGQARARQLLAELPPAAVEFYEVAQGPAAARLLAEAKRDGDPSQAALAAHRYPRTPAGRE